MTYQLARPQTELWTIKTDMVDQNSTDLHFLESLQEGKSSAPGFHTVFKSNFKNKNGFPRCQKLRDMQSYEKAPFWHN